MKFIPKELKDFPHISEHNWLIHRLMVDFLKDVAIQHVSDVLVDIGCDQKPYQSIFAPYVSHHIGVDLPESRHADSAVDIIGSAYRTNLDDLSCEVILCTEVLEHLEDPLRAIKEMHRILKFHGKVILTAPFFWPIHEAPRDFYRYSEYGLRYLFEQGGFEIIELRPLSGYVVTFTQISIYFLRHFQKGFILQNLGRVFNWIFQYIALKVNRIDRSTTYTNLYGLVARKV